MGLSIGASVAVGVGLLALGGGSVAAYYKYKDYRERQDIENYYRSLQDLDLHGKRLKYRIYSK